MNGDAPRGNYMVPSIAAVVATKASIAIDESAEDDINEASEDGAKVLLYIEGSNDFDGFTVRSVEGAKEGLNRESYFLCIRVLRILACFLPSWYL